MQEAYGGLFLSILLATLLAVPATWLVVRLYRRRVLALMAGRRLHEGAAQTEATGARVSSSPRAVSPTIAPPELLYITGLPGSARSASDGQYVTMRRRAARAALVYAAGGLCFAAVVCFGMTGRRIFEALLALPAEQWTTSLLWGTLQRNWAGQLWGLFLELCLFIYPTGWVIYLVTARKRRTMRAVTGLYVAFYVLLNVLEIHFVPQQEPWVFVALWLASNLMPTLFMAGFLYRGLQGVGPLIYAALLFGAVAALSLLLLAPPPLPICPGLVLLLIVGALAGMLLAAILRWLYERKWLSESSLMTDSIWLVFGFYYALALGADLFWTLNVLASFLLYKVITALGFALLAASHRRQAGQVAPQLLFLRVFALGKRAEQLFTSVANSWRYAGSICLITGPDLATATLAPHNLLDYLARRLRRLFIDSPEAVEQRMATLDLAPDPDGRYRVNEFFCYEDTWQMALSRLASKDVVVLSDLRQFSPQNAGCVYGIEELVRRVPLERVLFVVDDLTDERFLRQTAQRAWTALEPDSPNRRTPAPPLRLFHCTGGGAGDSDHLLQALAQAVA
jgi:hypothetical protein